MPDHSLDGVAEPQLTCSTPQMIPIETTKSRRLGRSRWSGNAIQGRPETVEREPRSQSRLFLGARSDTAGEFGQRLLTPRQDDSQRPR